jgi:hypothetical protein
MKMIEHKFKGRTVNAENINDIIGAQEADLNNQNLLSINNIGSVKKPLISYIIANKNSKFAKEQNEEQIDFKTSEIVKNSPKKNNKKAQEIIEQRKIKEVEGDFAVTSEYNFQNILEARMKYAQNSKN